MKVKLEKIQRVQNLDKEIFHVFRNPNLPEMVVIYSFATQRAFGMNITDFANELHVGQLVILNTKKGGKL